MHSIHASVVLAASLVTCGTIQAEPWYIPWVPIILPKVKLAKYIFLCIYNLIIQCWKWIL